MGKKGYGEGLEKYKWGRMRVDMDKGKEEGDI